MNRFYFPEDDPRFDAHVRLFGVGRKEVMPPGFVTRRRGLAAFLCVLFHDWALVEVMGREIEVLPETMILWDCNRPHHFGNGSRSWSHSWVVFSGEDCKHDWMQAVFERPQQFEESTILLGCFARLLREFRNFDKPDLSIISANIQLLLREMCRKYENRQYPSPIKDPVKTARHWIAGNLRQRLPVDAGGRNGLVFHLPACSNCSVHASLAACNNISKGNACGRRAIGSCTPDCASTKSRSERAFRMHSISAAALRRLLGKVPVNTEKSIMAIPKRLLKFPEKIE